MQLNSLEIPADGTTVVQEDCGHYQMVKILCVYSFHCEFFNLQSSNSDFLVKEYCSLML